MAKKKAKLKPKSKHPQKREGNKEIYYVGVQDPVEVRRNVLEVSKDMVQFLQQYQKLTTIRNEKQEALVHLRTDVEHLKKLVARLRRVLPKTKLRIKLHEEHEVFHCEKCEKFFKTKDNLTKHRKTHNKKSTAKKVKLVKVKKASIQETQATLAAPAPQVRKPASEIEKLESELADIENKLGKL